MLFALVPFALLDVQDERCNGHDDDADGLVDEGVCPCDSASTPSSRWLVCLEPLDAFSAAIACEREGWHLASIDSAELQEELYGLLAPYEQDFFIGLNDVAEEGVYVWEDGTPLGYVNYGPGQPNDLFGQDCTVLEATGLWADELCLDAEAFVCELEGPCAPRTWYDDRDQDGLGDPATAVEACESEPGQVLNGLDCDDDDVDADCDPDPDPDPDPESEEGWVSADVGDGYAAPPDPEFGFGCRTAPFAGGWWAALARRGVR